MNSMHMHIVDDPLNTVDYAKEVQPNLFCSVPRIYEKIFSNLTAVINQRAILKYGLKLPGISYLLKKKLKTAVGFGNLTFAISGAAPINPDILDLFQKLDKVIVFRSGEVVTTGNYKDLRENNEYFKQLTYVKNQLQKKLLTGLILKK